MPLSRDWDVRIDNWCKALHARLTRPIVELPMTVVATMEHLSVEAARRLKFKPIRTGAAWGREWEYAWFRAATKVPSAPRGKSIVLAGHVGDDENESIVFIDGVAAGGLDRWHRHIDLSAPGRGGRELEILLESYAGHRRPSVYFQFIDPAGAVMPPPRPTMQTFGGLHLAEWNEAAYQLWIDADTLRRLVKALPPDSLRRCRLEEALTELTCTVDLEGEDDELDAAVPAARDHLAPLLAAVNGTTAPEMFCIGHSHIDVAWLWPLAQTYRKNAHTFSTMLALMDRYREFRFLQSQAQLYDYVREQYPEIYGRIKRAARRGQWVPDGAMWVEADMNVSGGEALIRQFMLGKRFFKQEFGAECDVCWLPDVFGYNANLPQILRGCGVKYFSTQKIFWNLNGGTVHPYETFTWEGIDGSTVLAHLHRNYNAETHPQAIAQRWADCVQKGPTDKMLLPFGWGDGGGGPTRDHVEYLRREADLEGMPRTRYASLKEFFEVLDAAGPPVERWVGEMYLEFHRGAYTSQARTKRGNRKSELAIREAEMWSAVAAAGGRAAYPAVELEQTWKKLLLNQFHDILPGSSIGRVYEEAEALYEEVLADCDDMAASARASIAGAGDGWSVWNSLSLSRPAMVELPAKKGQCAVDAAGNLLAGQWIGQGKDRRLLALLPKLPPVGAVGVRLAEGEPAKPTQTVSAKAAAGGGAVLENEHFRVTIDRRGEIVELADKSMGRQVVPAGAAMNRLELYRDNPSSWDAWDIDLSYKANPVPLGPAKSVKVVAAGPLEARVAVERKIGTSSLTQQIVLRAGARRIDFETHVDWRETHRLLKVAFPADLTGVTLRGEIQFGHVVRPTNRNMEFERQRFEWPAQKWAAVSEGAYGMAVLNDCKYGYDFLDGVLRLSLLRAPVAPDPDADRGEHDFTYAVFLHDCPFPQSCVVRQAYDLNCPPTVHAGAADVPSFLEVSAPAVICEAIKRSEDGRGTIIRLYESMGTSVEAVVRFAALPRSAQACDMLETPLEKVPVSRDGSVRLSFRPFEVKTILLG